jgi:hypothetical protein
MLQSAVGEVSELAYVKQIGDQDIALGYLTKSYHYGFWVTNERPQ